MYAPIGQLAANVALGPLPLARRMITRDLGFANASVRTVFDQVRAVEAWPRLLPHYRHVRIIERDAAGGGVVDMSAVRAFGALKWPTWWRSLMEIDHARPAVRFRHIGGVTTGMDVDWAFEAAERGTHITLVHSWDGPAWPFVRTFAATRVIGPVFVHAIATLTLAGLARAAELEER